MIRVARIFITGTTVMIAPNPISMTDSQSKHDVFIVNFELGRNSKKFVELGYSGGFVSCAVIAVTIYEALKKSEAALKQDGYEIIFIESATVFEVSDWQHDLGMIEMVQSLSDDNSLKYSEFEVYGQ